MTDGTKPQKSTSARAEIDGQELCVGYIRLYILYRACAEPMSSRRISEVLADRGWTVGTRSIAQFCIGLKNKGYLESTEVGRGRQRRITYCATKQGRRAIEQARGMLRWAG
jgi:DNA-binding PadR family transcriptional regulator